MRLLPGRIYRGAAVGCLGLGLFVGISCCLLNSSQTALGSLHWGSGFTSDSDFMPVLGGLGVEPVAGTPMTVNGGSGHFMVFHGRAGVSALIDRMESSFAAQGAEQLTVGCSDKAGFFIAKMGPRTLAAMLIRDFNADQTLVLSVTLPTEVFLAAGSRIGDVPGEDPVPELRPPGSNRAFSAETDSFRFAAYKCMEADTRPFYEGVRQSGLLKATSITEFSRARLPMNGDLFFFEMGSKEGFVIEQSDPDGACSYSVVCCQVARN